MTTEQGTDPVTLLAHRGTARTVRVVTTVVTDDSQGNLAGKVKTMATTTRTSWRTMRLAGASACPSALAAYPSSVKPGNQAVEAVIDGTHFLPARVATPM